MAISGLRRMAGAIALVLAAWTTMPAAAQPYIEKAENKALTGSAFARLRNLTYQQCEERCLKDAQCIAFEHYRGGGLIRRSSNCALYGSVLKTSDSRYSDVGFKRQQTVAAEPGASKRSAARGVKRESAPSPEEVARARAEQEAREKERSQQTAEVTQKPVQQPGGGGEAKSSDVETRPATRSVRAAPPRAQAPPPVAAAPSIQPPPPPAPAATPDRVATKEGPNDRFHVVPVFYGTDRNQIKQDKRIGYGNDRARRLELGRALVSVPLDHKVPNIERPRAWTIPYIGVIQIEKEDPNKHFTVREIKTLTKAELLNLVKQRLGASKTFEKQSIVFIHGYNNSFDSALYRTAQISYDMQFDGAAFSFSWPSGGGLASYIYDRDSAQGAERYLYEFLEMVQNETGSTQISIIAHSMGNQMLVQVLRSLRIRAPDAMAKINQIILASPDIDRDAFEAMSAEITGIGKGITLYAAANDRALEASRIVAGNKPRAGDVPDNGPVIVSGIDTIDITQVSTAYLSLNHSGYAENTDLLTDIAQIIRYGTRPWERRLKAYKAVQLPGGTYWRYEK